MKRTAFPLIFFTLFLSLGMVTHANETPEQRDPPGEPGPLFQTPSVEKDSTTG